MAATSSWMDLNCSHVWSSVRARCGMLVDVWRASCHWAAVRAHLAPRSGPRRGRAARSRGRSYPRASLAAAPRHRMPVDAAGPAQWAGGTRRAAYAGDQRYRSLKGGAQASAAAVAVVSLPIALCWHCCSPRRCHCVVASHPRSQTTPTRRERGVEETDVAGPCDLLSRAPKCAVSIYPPKLEDTARAELRP